MRSNYKRLWKYIKEIKLRNKDLAVSNLLGINIDKFFMPSVANIVWTDMSKYKVVKKNQFACNRMHVWRDKRVPVALSHSDEDFIVSPAYNVFEIIDTNELLPEYLMMWFSRKEFDRINNNLIKKLEDTAQAIYKQWFVDFEFPNDEWKPYKSSGGEMVYCEELEKNVPKGWEVWEIWDYSKVRSWFAFKSEYWINQWTPVIKIWSISNKTIDFTSLAFVGSEIEEKALKYNVNGGDIVIAMTWATIWKIWLVPENKCDFLVNQRVWMFDLGEYPIEKAPFLYLVLLEMNTQNEIANVWWDSAQANISNTQIQEIEILLPDSMYIWNFNRLFSEPFKLIIWKISESERLWKIRNLLLSRMATID